MICPSCTAENDEHGRFCTQCRAPLQGAHPQAGELILGGRFRVLRSLGKGGMGEILLAEDVKLGRKVAIKNIASGSLRECDSRARFLREAQAASRLEHPNICTIYEIAEEQGREFIVMQYVDGVTLDQLLKMKPLSLAQVLTIASQVAAGLAAAQEQGIVHRDIKPANIMIDRSGQVKILDFGLAKICPDPGAGDAAAAASAAAEKLDRDLTEKGIVLGTVSYMSPEQAKGLKLDGRTDVFSFGVVLYEMLENVNPFSDDENIVTLYNILHREVQFQRPAPAPLRAIVSRCLQKERDRRYRDFAEIRQALGKLQGAPPRPAAPVGAQETEVIDTREQRQLYEVTETLPASDGEHLSEMVRRLKRMKASTAALRTSRLKHLWLLAALIPALALGLWLLLHRNDAGTSPAGDKARPALQHVLLYPLENQTADPRIGEEIDYLLQEALNQSPGFKALAAAALPDPLRGDDLAPGRLAELKARYGVSHVLRGKLTGVADKFNIEARLLRLGEREEHAPFFIPGKEKDSLLTDQVDNLARRVHEAIAGDSGPASGNLAAVAAMYGSDWWAFDLFFQGLRQWEKKKFGPARELLLRADREAGGLPAARLHLALLDDYTGDSGSALAQLQAITPLLPGFSLPQRLRVRALKAKFDFDLPEQVRCLNELKAMFPFRKEMAYEVGEAYFSRGDASRAIPEYEAALALDRSYAAALNHLGYCYSYLGRHPEAIECFERYRDIDRTANSFDSLGDGYFYLGDYTQAENSKIYAVSLDDSMDWPYLTLADIHALQANFDAAEKDLQEYSRRASYPKAQADALARRALLRCLDGDAGAALALLEQALARHDSTAITDHSGEYHWLKGLCLVARNDPAAAAKELGWLRALNETYRLSAENFDAAFKFRLHLEARIAEAEKRPDKAREAFRRLLAMKAQLSYWITYYSYPYFLGEYAGFLLRQHDLPAAREAIETGLAFNPGYPPLLWYRVELRRQSGERGFQDDLRRIAAIYGSSGERNRLRDKLAAELSK